MPSTVEGLTKLITQASGASRSTSAAISSAIGVSRSARNTPSGPMVSAEHMRMPCRLLMSLSTPRK